MVRKHYHMSTELRWFHNEMLPERIKKWFVNEKLDNNIKWKKRTDYYLAFPNEKMGIKLREGKLEIKYRIKNYSFVNTSASKKEGIAENWIKWEWNDKKVEELQNQSVKEDDSDMKRLWMKVIKDRAQRKYKISQDKNNPLKLILDENENADCAVELTRIKVLDKDWWTLGFDYFIDEDDERDNSLGFIIDWILKDYPDNNLHTSNSYGYPKWLSTLQTF